MKKLIFTSTLFLMSFAVAKTALPKATTTKTKVSVPDACVERAALRVISHLESEDSDTQLYVVKNLQGQVTGIMDNTYINADLDLESIKIKTKNVAHIIFSSPDYSAMVMVKFDPIMPVCQILKVESSLND